MVFGRRKTCEVDRRTGDSDERQDVRVTSSSTRCHACCVASVVLAICGTCAMLSDWLLAPMLAILAGLVWCTRSDMFAVIPGFAIGFIAGVIMSAGIGPTAAIDCGFYGGVIGSPLSALCRGHWRAGVGSLFGIAAFICIVQVLLLLLTSKG
jgi:hypothetical protein